MRTTRGQLFSYDLLFASVFLVFLLTLFLLTSNTLSVQVADAEARAQISEAAQDAADSLVHTPGGPSNWQLYPISEGGTASLGLASAPGELDPQKVAVFFSMGNSSAGYNASIYVLGLTSQNYRYNASLEQLNGTPVASLVRFPASSPPAHAVSIERFARLNGTVLRFRMVVWDE